MYLVMTVAVGLKEHPLPDEGKMSFWWRVAGRAAFATFKNIYGTWKLPGTKQPQEYVVATTLPEVPKPMSEQPTDKQLPASENVTGSPAAAPGAAPMPQVQPAVERPTEGQPGPVSR